MLASGTILRHGLTLTVLHESQASDGTLATLEDLDLCLYKVQAQGGIRPRTFLVGNRREAETFS